MNIPSQPLRLPTSFESLKEAGYIKSPIVTESTDPSRIGEVVGHYLDKRFAPKLPEESEWISLVNIPEEYS
jgi:hypothetical protein